MKIIKSRGPEIFDIELEKDLLAKNRSLAKENKKKFDHSNILAIDFMGSIGSGKTSLIKARIHCKACGYKGGIRSDPEDSFRHLTLQTCPQCNAFQIKVEKGRECILRRIQAVR